jgi:4,5-DOPA dioxygenase extradiol
MTTSPAGVASLADHADFGDAVPTPDHFIPLLYLAGLASAEGSAADVLVDGCAYGSLSMTSYTLDATYPEQGSPHGAPALPGSDTVPTDETNT